jgi:hypothetical protein
VFDGRRDSSEWFRFFSIEQQITIICSHWFLRTQSTIQINFNSIQIKSIFNWTEFKPKQIKWVKNMKLKRNLFFFMSCVCIVVLFLNGVFVYLETKRHVLSVAKIRFRYLTKVHTFHDDMIQFDEHL